MSTLNTIDVVTTATLRPDLLDLTFASFMKKCLERVNNKRLIINIDPIGFNATVEDVLAVGEKYFDQVVYRVPDQPSFSKAVQWGWSQVESDIFLHLEDDWFLRKKVALERVASYFEDDERLAGLTLNEKVNGSKLSKDFLALRPTFFNKYFVHAALPLFDLRKDPEKQWRVHLKQGGELQNWDFKFFGETYEGRHIFETGAAWRAAEGLDKKLHGDVGWLAREGQGAVGKRFSVEKYKWRMRLLRFLIPYSI